jgi:ribose-phosphate pyrophosphokinase
LFVAYAKKYLTETKLAVISPDAGGMKRAELLREALEAALDRPVGKGLAEKHRSAGVVSGDLFARSARAAGAKRVIALVTHGLFMPGSAEVLVDPALDQIIIADTVPPFRLDHPEQNRKLVILPAAPLLAETIRRLHEERSLTDLMVF